MTEEEQYVKDLEEKVEELKDTNEELIEALADIQRITTNYY